MKLNQENNEQSNNIMQKIYNNINRTMTQQKRLYSSINRRPFTSTKLRKTWNYGKYFLDSQNLGYSFQNSKYFTKNLYLNKKSFAWGKNKLSKPNKYYESERLFERVMQLQNKVNLLNDQNTEQKIEINKQKKELIKQNKLLNEVNKKMFFDNLLNNNESEVDTVDGGGENSVRVNDNTHMHTPLSKRRCYSSQQINGINNTNNKKQNINLDNISNDNLKDLYKKILKQNQVKEKEILRLKQKIDSIHFSNETLISNMKHQYKQLQNENNKKTKEFQDLKKSTKCTKYNELMKEKEVYEKEMHSIKDKFHKMSEVLEKYKNCFEENKKLKEEINKKNVKINNLQNEIVLFSQNSENIINSLKKEINKKNKKIQKLENEMKKYICSENSIKDNKKMIKNNSFNKLIFSSRNNDNNIYNINKNKNDFNSNNLYFNHCLNFNKNNSNTNQFLSPSSYSSRANLFSASWKNIKIKNQKLSKEKSRERVVPTRNSRVKEIILSDEELYQLYIEMKKRNINDSKAFINEVLLNLKDDSSNTDNKKYYYNAIIKLFKVEDESGKKIVENLSTKEFGENKQLKDIKMHNLKILNELFSLNQEKNNKDILDKKLKEIDKNKFINSIKKYDEYESGYIYFNQMISIIKEFKLEQNFEDILLLTKEPDVFNLMNYNVILDIINQNDKKENNENIEIKDKNDDKPHSKEINDNKNDIDKNNDEDKNIGNNKSNDKNKNNNIIDKNDKKEDITLNKEKNDNSDNKEVSNNGNNNTSDIENEFKDKEKKEENKKESNDNQDIINEKVEQILKNFAHIILIEGSTPYNYISSLKETNNLKDNNSINVINPQKLFKFLEEKKISMSEDEKNGIIKEYGIKIDDNNLFIDHDKLVEKLFENLKNDEGNSNDEDFMKNIKNYDIEGID